MVCWRLMIDMKKIVDTHDIVFITLDSLRFDVASEAFNEGATPHFFTLMSGQNWEERHSPGSFTFAAHHAFFSGFLPTPNLPGRHPRLFAASFAGSQTSVDETYCFEEATIMEGLSKIGFVSFCAGGVGFFNKKSALGGVLPDMFDYSHWEEEFGVTEIDSPTHQFSWMAEKIRDIREPVFSFVNVSAIHQPNCHYVPGQQHDDIHSQKAALSFVDSKLPILINAFQRRERDSFWIVCSDHGSAYGEDGFDGHRLAHPTVWNVPYCEFVLTGCGS